MESFRAGRWSNCEFVNRLQDRCDQVIATDVLDIAQVRQVSHMGEANVSKFGKFGIFALLGVGAIGAAVVGWQWYLSRDAVLSKRPEMSATPLVLPSRDSRLSLRISVPLAAINKAANEHLPGSYDFGGNGEDYCEVVGKIDLGVVKSPGTKVCAGTKYSGTVEREGDPTISDGGNNTLRLSVPISVKGKGGFRGTGADILDLDAKNFRAKANVVATVSPTVDENWCPILNTSIDYSWIEKPQVEIVSKVWLDVTDLVKGKLNDKIEELRSSLRTAVPCGEVRDRAQQAWRTYSIPIMVEGAPTLYARMDPAGIGLSAMSVSSDISIAMALIGKTEISSEPGPEAQKSPLPPMTQVPNEKGRVSISLPVRVGYQQIIDALQKQVAGKPFSFPIGDKQGFLTINAFEVFPVGASLAIGMEFTADIPGRIFSTSGKVFLTAQPEMVDSPEFRGIRTRDIVFSRDLDNELWSLLTVALESQIKQELEKAGSVDLSGAYNKAIEALQSAIKDPAKTGNIQFVVENPSIVIEAIVPEADSLAVLIRAETDVDAKLASLQ